MDYFKPTSEVVEGIAIGTLVCLKEATRHLGLSYPTGRRRILRERLPIWALRGRRYVRLVDLAAPALRVP